jgi:hypothetical protein
MARGRRKPIEDYKKEVIQVERKAETGVDVLIKKSLIHSYRISGKVGDVINVPVELVDELIQKKLVVKI